MPITNPLLRSQTYQVFKRLEIMAHSVVEGFTGGMHRSPLKGFAIEFVEHREYSPGDDLRHLDWKAYGKLNRYYVKQYEEDTAMRAYIVLDTSGSMGYTREKHTKLDFGRYISGVFSYLLLQQQDSVGLATCSDSLETFLPPRSTRRHFKRMMDVVGEIQPRGETRLSEVLHTLAQRLKRRALIVIVSDLFEDPDALCRALNHFAHKKHQVVLFRVLDRMESDFTFSDPIEFDGLEGGDPERIDPVQIRREYQDAFEAHRNKIRKTCFDRRIDFVELYTDENFERAMAGYLVGRMKRGK